MRKHGYPHEPCPTGLSTPTPSPANAYQLSGSSLVVGLLGIVELCPLLVTAFLGGALADARDRRRMLLLTDTPSMAANGSDTHGAQAGGRVNQILSLTSWTFATPTSSTLTPVG